METRFAISRIEERQFTTEQRRQHFLVDQLMQDDAVKLIYTHYDRVIIGGIKPISKTISLPAMEYPFRMWHYELWVYLGNGR